MNRGARRANQATRPAQEIEAALVKGVRYHKAGHLPEAERLYRHVLKLDPRQADGLHLLGMVAFQRGDLDRAAAMIRQAIGVQGKTALFHLNLGNVLAARGQLTEAIPEYETAIRLTPNDAEAHYNLGNVLKDLGRLEEAATAYAASLRLNPNVANTHCNLGNVLKDLGRLHEARASYDAAIALTPDFAGAHFNRALVQLTLGDYAEGWRGFEWRKRLDRPVAAADFGRPLWTGQQDIAGRTVFLHWEQGYGDTIQFSRYAKVLKARAARVVLSVPDALVRLLTRLDPDIAIIADGHIPDAFDFHCPLMTLPHSLGAEIPAEQCYLSADDTARAAWRARLAPLPGLKAGIVWAGGERPNQPLVAIVDGRRSVPLAAFAPLADLSGVSFISLQKGPPAAQARTPPAGMILHDWTDALSDFADTAALIAELDLVISVDTAVVHLAGALGKPVWILNRFDTCWRWLTDRTDTPWYPAARLFRQRSFMDWGPVFEAVRKELAILRDEHRTRPVILPRPPATA